MSAETDLGAADAVAPPAGRVGRNTLINLAGAVAPTLVALVTVPAYLHRIGDARYGVMAVVWVVFGYFGVFELGLSRATANQIARLRHADPGLRERVFWTALALNAAAGLLGAAAVYAAGQLLLGHVLKVTPELRTEALAGVPWLALGVPATTITLVLMGTLEGRERFLTANVLSNLAFALFQLAPLGYAYWQGPDLAGLIMSAMIALVLSTCVAFVVTAKALHVTHAPRLDRARVGALFRYGGWITVSGLVGPLLTVVDRVVIGALRGATNVARYTVPFTLVSRASVISTSVSRTLFPRLSTLDEPAAAALAAEALRALAAGLVPLLVAAAVLLGPFLRAWVGHSLAHHALPVGTILLLGMWVNSIAVIPYCFLQARGRPDLTARFHVLEMPPYVATLFLAVRFGGIEGAAWAWTARAAADAVLLFGAARRAFRGHQLADVRAALAGTAFVAGACVLAVLPVHDEAVRVAVAAALVGCSSLWGWRTAPGSVRLMLIRAAGRSGSS